MEIDIFSTLRAYVKLRPAGSTPNVSSLPCVELDETESNRHSGAKNNKQRQVVATAADGNANPKEKQNK